MRRALCRSAAVAGAFACLALPAGCGDGGLPRQLTPGQRADLHTLVGQARAAAAAGDLGATQAALQRLAARVRTLRDDGALEKGSAAELLKHGALAELKAAHTIAPPPAAVTPPPAAPPAPSATAPPADTPALTPPATPSPAGSARPGKKAKGHGHGKGAKQGG
ncbi:MAG: hypothetical protein QOG42_155 [Solirubrobacteraceae bacterium]|nr:hypothetical protein [Solirubrobacteraceae bacterium]